MLKEDQRKVSQISLQKSRLFAHLCKPFSNGLSTNRKHLNKHLETPKSVTNAHILKVKSFIYVELLSSLAHNHIAYSSSNCLLAIFCDAETDVLGLRTAYTLLYAVYVYQKMNFSELLYFFNSEWCHSSFFLFHCIKNSFHNRHKGKKK